MEGTLQILQIGDGQLDQPIHSGCPLPDDLHAITLNAHYDAFQKAVDAAIRDQVDLFLITGSLFNDLHDRRPAWFALQKFQQLRQAGIQIVWMVPTALGVDAKIDLMGPVHLVTPTESLQLQLADRSVVFHNGEFDTRELHAAHHNTLVQFDGRNIRVAANGHHQTAPRIALQATSASDQNSGAAHLWEIADTVRLTSMPTEVVAWKSETVQLNGCSWNEVLKEVHQRWDRLCSRPDRKLTLCDWTFEGTGPAWDSLLNISRSELRRHLAYGSQQHRIFPRMVQLIPSDQQEVAWSHSVPVHIAFHELNQFRSTPTPHLDFTIPSWASAMQSERVSRQVIPMMASRLESEWVHHPLQAAG